jgi:hypothetical protein
MPPRRLVLAFVAFWLTLGLVVLAASIQTFLAAVSGTVHGPSHAHLGLLAGVEAIAAALFLVPRTMRLGGIGLLVVFAVAFIAHALSGEFATTLLLYAAGTLFVLVHGPVPRGWLRRSQAGAMSA